MSLHLGTLGMMLMLRVLTYLTQHGVVAEVPMPADFPEYKRGPIPNWLLPIRNREDGIAHLGRSSGRFRVFLDKLMKGQHVKVSAVGGSITTGHGSYGGYSYVDYLTHWFQDAYPGQVHVHQGSVPGTSSTYQSICSGLHARHDADLYIVEFSHNDIHMSSNPVDSPPRRAMERLLRKFLALPQKPAVMFVHCWEAVEMKGVFTENAEADFREYELYYSLPAVTVKGAVFYLFRKNVTGFVPINRNKVDDDSLMYLAFYGDMVHPSGITGYRVISELIIHLIMKEVQVLNSSLPLDGIDIEASNEALPPPMVDGNEPAVNERCYVGQHLERIVTSSTGFDWMDESPIVAGRKRKKWGFVATDPGAVLKLQVDTKAASHSVLPQKEVLLMIAYLQSYEHMGVGSITCEGGCNCTPSTIQGHHPERKVSQMELHYFRATQSDGCIVVITVASETNSGEHKVKIQGLFIADEPGLTEGDGGVTRGSIDSWEFVGIDAWGKPV